MRIIFLILAALLAGCGNVSARATWTEYPLSYRQNDANTGVAFDSKRSVLYHAVTDFGSMKSSVWVTDMSVRVLEQRDISTHVRYAQGIAYEAERDVVWVWGVKPGEEYAEYTDVFHIVILDMSGNVLETVPTPVRDNNPGMLALVDREYVWLKANSQPIARLYHIRSGTLLKEIDTGVAGEGVAVDARGTLWVHGETVADDQCVVASFSVAGGVRYFNSPSWPYCGAEGMVFDAANNLWLSTDDGIHFDIPGGNRVWAIKFPEGIM